ncbi:hypothetical protein EYF80_060142 [Liparis tanakae]|uniref:Uncharacterized protein n=1 Tax=Liparis tanakae TaxID=230148 RepID=A0A4Z2ELN6_9TELE|nr:hypothetical protein EYF80_060142 [Liparis tanakae]
MQMLGASMQAPMNLAVRRLPDVGLPFGLYNYPRCRWCGGGGEEEEEEEERERAGRQVVKFPLAEPSSLPLHLVAELRFRQSIEDPEGVREAASCRQKPSRRTRRPQEASRRTTRRSPPTGGGAKED